MKKTKLLVALLALSFLAVSPALAQSTGAGNSPVATLATVNIFGTRIVTQKNNNLTIDFNIFNGVGIQPGVRYSVALMSGDLNNQTLVDQKVYDEKLVLGSNATIHKEITYTAPGYLKGTFNVWVMSENDRGLPLGQGLAGKITLNGNGQSAEILPDSCFLKIGGDANNKYTLIQGVDVAPAENLILVCDVQNNFPSAITATFNFNTFYRVNFGDPISSVKQTSFSLASGQKKTLEFTIPKAAKPQAYNATLSLLDNKGTEISNEVTAHYVLQGDSATIQNLSLDKKSYTQGESALVTFSWTARADWFNGSRELQSNPPTSTPSNDVATLSISSNGTACADPYKQELDFGNMINVGLKVPIKVACPNPKVSFALEDKSGNVLDAETFNLNNSGVQTPQTAVSSNGISMKKIIAVLVAILLVISLILIAIHRKKRNDMAVFLALIIFSGAFFSLGARPAKADTFVAYTGCALQETITFGFGEKETMNTGWSNGIYDANMADLSNFNLPNRVFNLGDQMMVTGITDGVAACSNGATIAGMAGANDYVMPTPQNMAKLQGQSFTIFNNWAGLYLDGAIVQQVNAPGSHYVSFIGQTWNPMRNGSGQGTQDCGSTAASGWDYRDHYEIWYTVNSPPPPPPPPVIPITPGPGPQRGPVDGACGTPTNGKVYDPTDASDFGTTDPLCSSGSMTTNPANPTLTLDSITNWTCLGESGGADSPNCSASLAIVSPVCPGSADSNCSHTPLDPSSLSYCSGACGGGSGTQSGTCADGCGGTGHGTQACVNNLPCCTCSAADDNACCQGQTCTNACGAVCPGTSTSGTCSNNWKEVAP